MDQYPEDLVLSTNDFPEYELNKAVIEASPDYHSIWKSLSKHAKETIDAGKQAEGKALWLFSGACSMMMSNENSNDPFKPFFVFDDRRGKVVSDFSKTDIDFFASVVHSISNVFLKARIADVIWTADRSRGPEYPLLAIDSYMSMSMPSETEEETGRKNDVRDCWERAIVLAKMLREGAGNRLKVMESKIVDYLITEDDPFAYSIADILGRQELGRDRAEEISDRLKLCGKEFLSRNRFDMACQVFKRAFNWLKGLEEDKKSDELAILMAETWVENANSQSSHTVAAGFYRHAIKALEKIPNARRERYQVEERIEGLRTESDKASEQSLSEMGVIQSDPIDVTPIIKSIRDVIKGKETTDALLHFVNSFDCNVDELREETIEQLKQFPLQGIIPASTISRRGHVTGFRPGINLQESEDSESNRAAIEAKMVENLTFQIQFSTESVIIPALEVIQLEHTLNQDFFFDLSRKSPIVPPGREGCFGKGLYFGYCREFGTAIHILTPQIENLVRYFLSARGVYTTHIRDGIEHEVGLSSLLEKAESKEIMGDHLHFQIKSLFCHQFGPNLRNVVAHGLIGDSQFNSTISAYSWWFVLKIVFNTYFNSINPMSETEEE